MFPTDINVCEAENHDREIFIDGVLGLKYIKKTKFTVDGNTASFENPTVVNN